MTKTLLRVVVPDSHGCHIDKAAEAAFLRDLKSVDPDEVVLLGDHLDCGGVFSSHARAFTNELTESFEDDCASANAFLDGIQKQAPRAKIHYLEGNHEQRIERWITKNCPSSKDANLLLSKLGPQAALELKRRGIKYYKTSEKYGGVPIPGTLRLVVNGRPIYYTHGISHSANATAVHLLKFGGNVVHGHTHRSASVLGKTVTSGVIGAWCPGTLALFAPLYMHTRQDSWSHGYGLEAISASGRFVHFNVPLVNGESMLNAVTRITSERKGRAA